MDKIIYEKLHIVKLLKIILMFRNKKIYYFEADPLCLKVLSRMKKAGVFREEPKRIDFYLSELKAKDTGESLYPEINKKVLKLCERIKKNIESSMLIKRISRLVSSESDKLSVYFLKKDHQDIVKKIIYITVIKEFFDSQGSKVFYPFRPSYFYVLKDYAGKEMDVNIGKDISFLDDTLFFLYHFCILPCKDLFKILFKKKAIRKKSDVKIATIFTGRDATLHPEKRSDLFWINSPNDLGKELLFIFPYVSSDVFFEDNIADELDRHNIKYVALDNRVKKSERIKVWSSGMEYILSLIKLNLISLLFCFGNIDKVKLNNILYFNRIFSFWRDLIKYYGVKIIVNPPDYDSDNSAVNIALSSAGGVSVNYQVADFELPNIGFSSSSDVFFSFGPYYKEKLKKSLTVSKDLIYTGYCTDYIFEEIKSKSLLFKEKMGKSGAKFIVGYFDEASSDSPFSIIKDKTSELIYRKLIEKVIKDREFGLICKPKKPKTLRNKIPSLIPLMEEAKKTGRCIFMEDGVYNSSAYPAQIAMSSDLVIGLLLGGTTVFESFLSGTPAFYLDMEKLYSYERYSLGKNEIVFDDIDKMFSIIEGFCKTRILKDIYMEKLSAGMKNKDNFRDGKSRERMNGYIYNLLEYLDNGNDKFEAIKFTNGLYAKRWGLVNLEASNS